MVWLPDGEKNFQDMFIRFDMIHERDRRTDGHRMTAIAALMHSIARQLGLLILCVKHYKFKTSRSRATLTE